MIQKHLYSESTKPDVHLKVIFKASNIINPNEKSITKQDLETFKAIDTIAIQNNITPYAVDKIFWLLGSGNPSQNPNPNKNPPYKKNPIPMK
jgi:hypothetical protein